MKIQDITTSNTLAAADINKQITVGSTGDLDGAKRNASHPEVAELLNARQANRLFDCQYLARDEMELARFIINRLDVNPQYVPSETLLQAIRAINDTLAGRSSLHGMIRTA